MGQRIQRAKNKKLVDGFDPLTLMLSSSSSGSLTDLALSPEKSLLVTADQESPTQEKDASVLVISSSESASEDEHDLLPVAAPTRVSSLDEGPTTFMYALLDPVNVDDSDYTSRAGSQTTTSFF